MEDSGRPLRADATAPSVIATAPEDGSTGVLTSTSLTFEFDEPMDPDSTVASVTSNATLTGVLLSADGTVLTVEAELQYGLPNTPPRSYTVTVGADATDRAGNELGAPVEISFSTAVRHELVIVPAFNDRHLRDGAGGTWLGAGDSDDDDEIQGQATFLLDELPPQDDILALEEARLDSSVFSVRGNPGTDFGEMVIDRIGPDGDWVDGYSAPSLGRHDEPLFADEVVYAIGAPVVVDLTSMLEGSLGDSDWRMRFRVSFEDPVSADQENDAIYISTRNSTLTVTYLTR